MEFLGMQPRDIYVLCEISRSALKKLELALSLVELKFNSSVEEEAEATEYLVRTFYPQIKEMIAKVEAEYGPAPDSETE